MEAGVGLKKKFPFSACCDGPVKLPKLVDRDHPEIQHHPAVMSCLGLAYDPRF